MSRGQDVEMSIPLGTWLPEAMEHGNPGVIAARGWCPWPTGDWRPLPYFMRGATNLGGMVYGGHYHTWGTVWEAYVARANSGNVGITRVTLQTGSPPSTLAIAAASDVTGTPWASLALVEHGYTFVSSGKYVILAGDETVQMQFRDSTTATAFADLIPAGSVDRPSCRFLAAAGRRLVGAYVKHNSDASRINYSSDALTDENLVIFSGFKSGITYWSTKNTSTGTNVWDPEELAHAYHMEDELGQVTALATSVHGYGWLWKERGVYRFDYQQSPVDFRLVSDQHGTRFPQSVVVVEDAAYWIDQLGQVCRVGSVGEVEPLSQISIGAALLDDDAVFLGRYPEVDLTQGKNTAEATAFAWGATERWRCSVDAGQVFDPNDVVYRYPQGFYDAHTGTVRWIYPGTFTHMQGVGSVASGQTTFSWSSGTLFDHADNSFMDGRSIELDGGTHTTTVASVTDRETLELAVAAPSNLTNVVWKIPFQRWLELSFQPATSAFAASDVTHAWNKTVGQRPWAMHWGISAPGFGLRLTQPADVPQRLSYGPRDVLYAFAYLQSGGADFYSLSYGWPYGTIASVDQNAYLLLEDPLFLTTYIAYPSEQGGVESGAGSRVAAIRPVYSSRQRAVESLGIDVELHVVVRSKRRAGTSRTNAGAVQGPLVSSEMVFDLGATTPGGDQRGWLSTSGAKDGSWHQIIFWFATGSFADADPVTAFEALASIDRLEVRLSPGAR